MDLQRERNELLKYLLLHPPPNVTIALPAKVAHVQDLDLTTCPLPLETYYKAEASRTNERFTFDAASNITFRSEGRSGVSRGGSGKADGAGATPATRSQLANNAMTIVTTNDVSGSPAPVDSPSSGGAAANSTSPPPLTSTEEGSKGAKTSSASAASRTNPGSKPSSPNTKNGPATFTSASSASTTPAAGAAAAATNDAANTNTSTSPGTLFGFRFGGALKGHHGGSGGAANALANTPAEGAAAASTGAGHRAAGKSTPARSLRSYFSPSFFTGSRAQESKDAPPINSKSSRMSEAACEDNSLSTSTLMPVRAWSFIPLHGTTSGTLRDTVATWLATVPPRRPLAFGACPELYNVSLCPLFDSTMLQLVMNDFKYTVYEHLLMANALLLGPNHKQASEEIYNIYMPSSGITASDHMQSMTNLMPPSLRSVESRHRVLSSDEVAHLMTTLQCNESTLTRLVANSTDDDFIMRMTEVIRTIRTYRDDPPSVDNVEGNAPYPLVLRALLFASVMVPLYRNNPVTNRPYAPSGSIERMLAVMKRFLSIPDSLVDYCALHAHLYANEEAVSDLKTQSTFLKGIARAVNTVVVHGSDTLQTRELTPEVKYCYYVLQETLSLAMTPMPWLETLWSGDALRSVSALFIEVCLSLPPCFLSVFVLVDGQPLLFPQWSSGMCLLELLSFFMSVSAFRRFGDIPTDQMPVGAAIEDLLRALDGLDDPQLAYARMLSKSFPHALGLVCPLRMQFATFALRRHWSIAPWLKEGDTCAGLGKALASIPPPDLAPSLNAVLRYLLGPTHHDPAWNGVSVASNNESESELSQTMEVLALNASYRLHSFQAIVEQFDTFWFEKIRATVRTVVSKGGWSWEKKSLSACCDPPPETAQLFQLGTNIAEIPPPLGSNPTLLYGIRLSMLVETASAMIDSLLEGVPVVLSATRTAVPAAITSASGGGGGAAANGAPGSNGNNNNNNNGNAAAAGAATGGPGNGTGGGVGTNASTTAGSAGPDAGEGSPSPHNRIASQAGGLMPTLTSGFLHPAGTWRPQPLIIYDRLQQYNKQYLGKTPPAGPTVPELVQRLNTLHVLRQQLSLVLVELQRQYERVARVTGALAVDQKSSYETLRTMIREAERWLCESLGAAAVLRPSFVSAMTTQLLRWDEKAYKAMKRKDREALPHYPLAFPDVTLERLLADINRYLLELMPLLPQGSAVELRSQTGLFLVCALYATFLEGDNVYLTPLDAQPIQSQLCTLRVMFFPRMGDAASRGGPAGTGGPGAAGAPQESGDAHQRVQSIGGALNCSVNGGVFVAANAGTHQPHQRGSSELSVGEQCLNELCNVVRYVMSQPSSLLTSGGNGVPPLNSLPDRADNSPWCKYIVHRVLDHRKDKDAKKQASDRSGFWGS